MISYIWAMEEGLVILRIWSYRETLSTSVTSLIFSFSRILMATGSLVVLWIASLTFPKVPFPIVLLHMLEVYPIT